MHMHISVIILTVEDRASPVSFGASLYSIEEKEKRKKKKNNIKNGVAFLLIFYLYFSMLSMSIDQHIDHVYTFASIYRVSAKLKAKENVWKMLIDN